MTISSLGQDPLSPQGKHLTASTSTSSPLFKALQPQQPDVFFSGKKAQRVSRGSSILAALAITLGAVGTGTATASAAENTSSSSRAQTITLSSADQNNDANDRDTRDVFARYRPHRPSHPSPQRPSNPECSIDSTSSAQEKFEAEIQQKFEEKLRRGTSNRHALNKALRSVLYRTPKSQ